MGWLVGFGYVLRFFGVVCCFGVGGFSWLVELFFFQYSNLIPI